MHWLSSLQRLKRELGVAITEEDYATAARIRDHPFMQMYTQMRRFETKGNVSQAVCLRQELDSLICKQDRLNRSHSQLLQDLKSYHLSATSTEQQQTK